MSYPRSTPERKVSRRVLRTNKKEPRTAPPSASPSTYRRLRQPSDPVHETLPPARHRVCTSRRPSKCGNVQYGTDSVFRKAYPPSYTLGGGDQWMQFIGLNSVRWMLSGIDHASARAGRDVLLGSPKPVLCRMSQFLPGESKQESAPSHTCVDSKPQLGDVMCCSR